MNKTMVSKKEIETYGKFTGKTVYGICKEFAWKVYDYKGERYEVAQFGGTGYLGEVRHIARIYCECCGRAFLPSKIKIYLGLNTCLSCAKG